MLEKRRCSVKRRLGHTCRLSSSLARRIFATNMRPVAFSHALLLCACVSSAAGFSAPHASATRPRAELLAVRRQAVTVSMIEEIPRPDAGRFPFRTVVLGLLSLQSAIGLTADNELGGLITRFQSWRHLCNCLRQDREELWGVSLIQVPLLCRCYAVAMPLLCRCPL